DALRAAALQVRVVGREFVEQTHGRPTVIVAPMTVAMPDALLGIRAALGARPCVVFGQDVEPGDLPAADRVRVAPGGGPSAARHILSAVRSGAVYCTYADFVYQGHRTVTVELFGRPRP